MRMSLYKLKPENWRDSSKDEAPEDRSDLSDSTRRLDMLKYSILRCISKIEVD